jgi:paraquat-inducible protein A
VDAHTMPQMAIQKLSLRNKLAFFTSILSVFFFFPGIYLSMLSIATTGSINAQVPHIVHNFIGFPHVAGTEQHHIALNIFDSTRSILKTVHDLWNQDYIFVASMIFLFSVIVPLIKGSLLTVIFFNKHSETRKKVFAFIKSIGKWSMCDVYIVAIFLAYLSTGATQTENAKTVTMLGYAINVDVLAGMQAHLQIGFWCFLTYCFLSLLALQLYEPY